jgi:hypothetical protein
MRHDVFQGGWNPTYRAAKGETRERIFAFICLYADEHGGNSPSILEVSKELDLAYGTVYGHVSRMINQRRLEQRDGKIIVIGAEWNPPPN